MLCNICNKNQATVHLTEIVDEQMSELHLCDECARKKSMEMEQQFGLSDLLAGLVDYGKHVNNVDKGPVLAQCPRCGLTFEDFGKIGRLGCSECYAAFSKNLGPLLKRIHGSSQHIGKAPSGFKAGAPVMKEEDSKPIAATTGSTLSELKDRLVRAIQSEEFEEAAKLRDQIKEMETGSKETDKEVEKKKRKNQK